MSAAERPPAVSVIIATYRRPHLLPRAIRSVLAQTFTDFELIVVDDGSGDETAEVVAGFVDPRLRYICLETNGGVANARNQAVERAQGEWLVFVDDDDRVEPEFIATLIGALSQATPRVGFGWTWKRIVALADGEERELRLQTYGAHSADPRPGVSLYARLWGGAGGLTVRRAAFGQIGGFNPQYQTAEDLDLLLRMAPYYDYVVVPEPLYLVSNHEGGQLTKFSLKQAHSHELLLAQHGALLSRRVRRNHVLLLARIYFALDRRADGRRVLAAYLRREPWQWRAWKAWAEFEMSPLLPAQRRQQIFRPIR